jgi:hypothetical protein
VSAEKGKDKHLTLHPNESPSSANSIKPTSAIKLTASADKNSASRPERKLDPSLKITHDNLAMQPMEAYFLIEAIQRKDEEYVRFRAFLMQRTD